MRILNNMSPLPPVATSVTVCMVGYSSVLIDWSPATAEGTDVSDSLQCPGSQALKFK